MADAYTDAQEEEVGGLGGSSNPSDRRYAIMREALKRMGASVISGALTTVMASSMLVFTTIRIFFRFGVVVSVNMSVSVILSIFLFSAIMMCVSWKKLLSYTFDNILTYDIIFRTFGPVGHTGDLFHVMRSLFSRFGCCKRLQKEEQDDSRVYDLKEMNGSLDDNDADSSAEIGMEVRGGDEADAELQ